MNFNPISATPISQRILYYKLLIYNDIIEIYYSIRTCESLNFTSCDVRQLDNL